MKQLAVLLIGLTLAVAVASDVDVWLTRGDEVSLLEQRPTLTFTTGSGTHATKINVDDTTTYQMIDGFGAAVTDSSAWLIWNELNATQRATLLDELFSSVDGIGISFVRIPMGASDFALSAYTYDDMPPGQTDPNLENFSIAHDLAYIIPTLLEARNRNPELKVMGSPWSPPAWMKTTESLWGGALETQYYDEYTEYFVRFVQDYEAAGIPIHSVTPQNEPLNDTTAMPASTMQTYQQSAFVGDHLGPAFVATGIDAKIIIFDHNWADWSYPVTVMNDPEAGQYAVGAAFHGYDGDVSQQSQFHNIHPTAEVHFTEITGGEWATNFADNLVWGVGNIIIGTTRNWSRSAIYWNVALDQNHGPRIGGCPDCRGVVTINTGNGAVTHEVEYYIIGHASKFVQPSAVRIASDSHEGTLETTAFRNPDGSIALIALNPSGSSRWFDVLMDGEYFAYRLTGRSVATFAWGGTLPAGDFDSNGVVDFDDIDDGTQGNANSLFDYLGQAPPRPEDDVDATGDSAGVIDVADLYVLVEQLIGSLIGDLTHDYFVDLDDFELLAAAMGTADGYFSGDLDGTLAVDVFDFAVMQRKFSPAPSIPNLISNPGFEDLNGDGDFGDSWGRWGDTNFNDYWSGNAHASLFADAFGNNGGIYQQGIPGTVGQTYQFDLLNVRIEDNADADFRFGLEFFPADDATLIQEVLIPLDTSTPGDGLTFSMSAPAPAGTVYVRPMIRFDNVQSVAGNQDNVFVFDTALHAVTQ